MHLSDASVDMRASVERDHAGPAHLHVEHHVIGTLEHLCVAVVPGPESRHAPADAPLTPDSGLPVPVRAWRGPRPASPAPRRPPRCGWGRPAVSAARSPATCGHPNRGRPSKIGCSSRWPCPATRTSALPPRRRRTHCRQTRHRGLAAEQLARARLQRGQFLRGQRGPITEYLGALQGRDIVVRPHPLQVRMTVGRTRHGPGPLARGGAARQRQRAPRPSVRYKPERRSHTHGILLRVGPTSRVLLGRIPPGCLGCHRAGLIISVVADPQALPTRV